MANSRKSARKPGTVKQFPSVESGATDTEPPTDTENEVQPAADPVPPPRPRIARDGKPSNTLDADFFQRLAKIPRADWGNKVYLYLYVLEPVCNLRQQGGKSYLMRYEEPVADENRIMLEHGSGRYRFMLSQVKNTPEAGTEIARYEFEIYNPQYPPKIPKEAWVSNSLNRRWEALLPKVTPPAQQSSLDTFVDVLRATNDIRREIKEEMTPEPPAIPIAAAQPAPIDPWSAAEKILNMRSENPMVAILQQQMADAAKAAEAERERSFKAAESAREREFKLQEQLLASKTTATAAEKPKTLMEQLTDFKALKELFTANGNGAGEAVRTGRTTWLDVSRELGSKFFESDLASGVGQYLASLATRNVSGNGAPVQMAANPGTAMQSQPVDDFEAFIQNVLNPALLRHYIQGFTGAEFAGWLYDGYPDRVKQLQNFSVPMMPGLKGAPVIIQAYKRTGSMWPTLSSARPAGEAAFTEFVNEFCEWKPDTGEVIDTEIIEGSEHEEGPERI